jgi:hypothetical protein
MSFVSPATKKPLLPFSAHHERASIVTSSNTGGGSSSSSSSSSNQNKGSGNKNKNKKQPFVEFVASGNLTPMVKRKRSAGGGGKRRPKKQTVRLTKGRLSLCVAGFQGTHRLAPSALVRYIPLNKLKLAVKKVLRASGVPTWKGG